MDFNVRFDKMSKAMKTQLFIDNLTMIFNPQALFSDGTPFYRIPSEPGENELVRIRFFCCSEIVVVVLILFLFLFVVFVLPMTGFLIIMKEQYSLAQRKWNIILKSTVGRLCVIITVLVYAAALNHTIISLLHLHIIHLTGLKAQYFTRYMLTGFTMVTILMM